MIKTRAGALVLALVLAPVLLLAAAVCRAADPDRAGTVAADGDRRILVMLRMAPPHFRPDANYGSGYDAQAGQAARRRVASELAAEHGLSVESDWQMASLGVDCFLMRVAPNRPMAATLEALARDPRAAWAQPLQAFHSLGHDDPLFGLQPAAAAWHLADLHLLATGRNVSVAEVDSGVELTHPDLAGQVAIAENFVDASPYVAEAHGTAVAGIIAARADNGLGIAGVAPGARLMALRACWQVDASAARCNSFTLAKAFQFALDRGANVINLSLSGPEDKLLHLLLDAAVIQGVTVVGAVDPMIAGGGFPASHPGVIAVAQDGDDSSVASLVAPGRDVPTTLPDARWGFVDGSSFAAAHVSGMVALLRELAPTLGPEQTRALLRSTADPVSVASRAASRIDACAVVARATGACSCACAVAAGGKAVLRR